VQYSTVQYSTVQYKIQYSGVQSSGVQYSSMQYSTIQCSALHCGTAQRTTECEIDYPFIPQTITHISSHFGGQEPGPFGSPCRPPGTGSDRIGPYPCSGKTLTPVAASGPWVGWGKNGNGGTAVRIVRNR
jgi:hypothetical protein